MPPLALTDEAMREVLAAARLVPIEQRSAFLEAVAGELQAKVIGPGLAHRVAVEVAKRFAWDGDRNHPQRP